MKTMLLAIIVSASISAMAAPALAEDQSGPAAKSGADSAASGECLRIMNVWSYSPVPGNRALIVTDKSRRKYKMSFYGPCTGLQYHLGLEFRSRGTGGLSCLTRGDTVVTRDIVGPPMCTISSVVPYTPQMEKADKEASARAKMKKDK
jgi:hypothetical protein